MRMDKIDGKAIPTSKKRLGKSQANLHVTKPMVDEQKASLAMYEDPTPIKRNGKKKIIQQTPAFLVKKIRGIP